MELNAQKREKFGKKTKSLRKERLLPAVVFGKKMESLPVTVGLNDFIRVYRAAGETNLVDLKVDGTTQKVLITEVQVHPISSNLLHVNFHKVNLKEKVTASIPVEIEGDEENPLVKSGDGIVLVLLNEIEIEALPMDLPDEFRVNISGLTEIGDGISIEDLSYDREKVEIVGHDPEDLVVKIDYSVTQDEAEEELTEEEMLESIEVTEEKEGDDANTEEDE